MYYKFNNDDFTSKVKINRGVFVKYLYALERRLPADKRISTKRLAKRAGWSMSYAYHIVSQRTGNPLTMITLSKICQAFRMDNEQSQKWIGQMEKATRNYQIRNQKLIEGRRAIPNDIERLIRKICSKKHWPLVRVAKNADMNPSEISNIMKVGGKDPDPITLARLANALNIDSRIMLKAAKITKREKKIMPVIGGGDLADILSQQIHNRYMPIKLLATKTKVDETYINELLKNRGLNHLRYRDMKAIAKVLKLSIKTLIGAKIKSLQEIVGDIKPAKRKRLDLNTNNDLHFSILYKNKDNPYNIRPDVLEVARKLNHTNQIDTNIINMMVIRMLKAEEADKHNNI